MAIVSLTHASDIDGVGSAALFRIKYGIPLDSVFFTDYSSESLKYFESSFNKNLKKHKDPPILFIADLGLDKHMAKDFVRIIKGIKSKGGRVFWLDHHAWGSEGIEKVASLCDIAIVGENPRFCATEIAYRNLGLKGSFEKRFVEVVHYSDFNLKPTDKKTSRLIGIYAMSIGLYNMYGSFSKRDRALRHIVGILSEKKFTDARIIKDADIFEKINKRRTDAMLRKLYKLSDIAYMGFSDTIQATRGCGAIIEKTGCDIAIYVNIKNGKGHVRSVHSDTIPLSSMFGGGGHPHASGFHINIAGFNNLKRESDRKRLVKLMEKRVRRLYGRD